MGVRQFLAAALLAALALAAPAAAQNKIVNTPAEKFAIAPGGVDMRTGRYAYSETDLTGGGGQGALAITRIMPEAVGNHANPFGNFSHNFDIFVIETVSTTPGDDSVRMGVHYGGRSLTFESKRSIETYGYAFKSDGEVATLTYTGLRSNGTAVHTMRGPDGTSITFRPIGGEDCADQLFWSSVRRRCAFVSEMIEPDGTKYMFDYVAVAGAGNRARLSRVVSSRGFALLLEGSGNLVTRACLYNLAVTAAPAAGGACTTAALATAVYGYSGSKLASVTSPGNAVSSFTYPAADKMGFVKPGYGGPWLTHTIGHMTDEEAGNQEITTRQDFHDGQSYEYFFDAPPATNNYQNAPNPVPVVGGTYKDAEGRETIVRYGFPVQPYSVWSSTCTQRPCEVEPESDFQNWTYQQTSGPVELTDPLGRTTTADFCDPVATHCSVVRMQSSTDPEGIKTVYGYDGRGNISKATRYPRPGVLNPDGSTPAPTMVEAAYDIQNPMAQTKPLWMKDANGNVTTWTWSNLHGGILTETGPAVDGIAPQKRHSYVQRFARTVGGSAAGPAVWLLDRMSFCKAGNPSGAGCALGSADEVITAYDYGADDGSATNLLLRGQAVTAGGLTLRTCYAYDSQGRKISETSPRGTAGLAACPAAPPTTALPYTASTRYDPDGQVTGTIAPDPDGAGVGNGHPAVRNSYDPAGRLIRVEQGALAAWQGEWVAPAAWAGFTVHKRIDTEYDSLDRKTREWASGGGIVAGVTEYGYDLHGRVRCTALRMNQDVWAYPLPDKCVPGPAHAVHGPDRISKNVYDAAGQLIETWEGVGTPLLRREALYSYNGNGQRTSLTDARGFRAEMAYDGHGRQSRWIFPSKTTAGVADAADQEYYLYDAQGNRTKLRKRDGSILAYQYDPANRVTVKTVPASATGAPGYGVFTGYDNRGLQTYARFGSASGAGVTNGWDGFGRLAASTTTMGGVSRTLTFAYDADGNRTALQGDGGLTGYYADFAHDGLGRMTAYSGAARIGYDAAGRRSRLGLGWGADNSVASYGYDGLGRLASLGHDLAGASRDVTFGFTGYNPASQLLARTASNDAFAWTGAYAVSRPYSVNGLNQYIAAGPAAFAYDANGNLASDGST
ncbi:MAG TPA: hypothetical protein VGB04_05745, partial [Allosphingosinicella sp.]